MDNVRLAEGYGVIAVLSADRPHVLGACLASLRAYNGKWLKDVVVFDNASRSAGTCEKAAEYGVQCVTFPRLASSSRHRANAAREKIKDWFLANNEDELIWFCDDDLVFGPDVFAVMNRARLVSSASLLCGLHLKRTSKRLSTIRKGDFTLYPLYRMAEAFWMTTRAVIETYTGPWTPNVGWFKSVQRRGGTIYYVEGIAVQHLGTTGPRISKHIPAQALLLEGPDGKPVQPLPFEIDLMNPDFKTIEGRCNESFAKMAVLSGPL